MSVRRAARSLVGLLFVVAAAASGVAPGTAATAFTGDLQGECPTIMPLDHVSAGMTGTALSVVRGRNPVSFRATVLGVQRDALGPGRDLVIVDLSGPAIDAAGGLWYGASGSPLFLKNSRSGKYELVGAIAYGLAAGPSTLAGLTPAEDLAELLGSGGAERPAGRAVVSRRLATRMSAATGLSIAQVGSLVRLKTPLTASGLTDRGLRRMQAAIDRQSLPLFAYLGASATGNPAHPSGTLRAGDSFAAALSVGDVTVAGIGTTTFVCKGRAIAFGHPFNWSGETTVGARAADTITIVEDPLLGPYKLANVAESVGTVTQDRLAGLAAELGVGPAASPVTSVVTDLDTGHSRSGESDALMPDFLPFLSYEHLLTSVDVTIDRLGPGNAEMAYTIRGTREGGVPWELSRSSHYASQFDVSADTVWEPAVTAEILQGFEGEDITVTGMNVPTLEVEKAFEEYLLRRVLVWNGSKYVSRHLVRGAPGERAKLRAVLEPVHRAGVERVDLTLRVPLNAKRGGFIEVLGGASAAPEIPCFIVDEECGGSQGDVTFDQLLKAFDEQPRGDDLVARFRLGRPAAVRGQVTERQDAVVVGEKFIGFKLKR
jgi:hypothetical protein